MVSAVDLADLEEMEPPNCAVAGVRKPLNLCVHLTQAILFKVDLKLGRKPQPKGQAYIGFLGPALTYFMESPGLYAIKQRSPGHRNFELTTAIST